MNPLLKVAEELVELAQVAIKLSAAKSKARKRKFLERFDLEKADVMAALKASRSVILKLKKQAGKKPVPKKKMSTTKEKAK